MYMMKRIMKLILASASPRRKELLGKIGLEFDIIPAKGEEIVTKSLPWEVVEELSFQKAKEIADIGKVYVKIPADHFDIVKNTKTCDNPYQSKRAINGLIN